jgi:hypothetical protein
VYRPLWPTQASAITLLPNRQRPSFLTLALWLWLSGSGSLALALWLSGSGSLALATGVNRLLCLLDLAGAGKAFRDDSDLVVTPITSLVETYNTATLYL